MKREMGMLFLRITFAGNMLIAHGIPKLTGFNSIAASFPDPFNFGSKLSLILAIFAEVFCSVLILIGLKTRIATIPLIITMLTEAFIIHAGDPWSKQEFPLLYFYGFMAILLFGPGKYAIDKNTI